MRPYLLSTCLTVLVTAVVAAEHATNPIAPAEAAKKINNAVVVEMLVKSTGGRENCYLNSEEDFKHADNFTVFIAKEVKPKFQKAGIENPAEFYKGKTVHVSGTVVLFEKKPRIAVTEPAQIAIVKQK